MNGQPRINTIHCLIVMDKDNTEGVPAFDGGGTLFGDKGQPVKNPVLPAYFSDPRMLPVARMLAAQLVAERGVRVVLARFTERTDVEEFKP